MTSHLSAAYSLEISTSTVRGMDTTTSQVWNLLYLKEFLPFGLFLEFSSCDDFSLRGSF